MPDFLEETPPSVDKESAAFRSSLELLYEIGREVTADLDLRTLLHRVLFLSMKNVGAISGSIIVIDENGQPSESAFLILGQTHNHTALQLRVTYEHGLAGWVARRRQAALVPDTSQDERWLQRPEGIEGKSQPKSAVSVPILARQELVGVITLVHPQPGFFTQDHLDLTEAIADWAGTAILHAQLFDRLQAANRRYRELFEDNIDPILITDRAGQILEINRQAEKTTGVSAQDLPGVNIADLNVVEVQRTGVGFEYLQEGVTISYETTMRAKRGEETPVQVYARQIHINNETHLQWILRDISERKELDRLRDDLMAMIYHDLRSPLGNILSSLELLSNALPAPQSETVQTMLDIARRSTQRIQRLTYSLLDIHRLESGQKIVQPRPISLAPLIQEAIESIQPAAQSKRQTFSVEIEPQTPSALADADMIRRVLMNLFDNAVKFSPEDSEIQVAVKPEDGFVLTSVRDAGPGIPSAYQERIFEKFTRLGGKDVPKGLGLGLSYCRLTVNAHGGKIWVESNPGQGSIFKFTLPAAGSSES